MLRPGAWRNRNVRNILQFSFTLDDCVLSNSLFPPSPMHPSLQEEKVNLSFEKFTPVKDWTHRQNSCPHFSEEVRFSHWLLAPLPGPGLQAWDTGSETSSKRHIFPCSGVCLGNLCQEIYSIEPNKETQPPSPAQAMKDPLRKSIILDQSRTSSLFSYHKPWKISSGNEPSSLLLDHWLSSQAALTSEISFTETALHTGLADFK